MDRNTTEPRTTSNLSLWIVAFLDLLGYRSILNRFDYFPFPSSDELLSCQNSFRNAVSLRRDLLNTVKPFMESRVPPPADELMNTGIHHGRLSDGWKPVAMYNRAGADHIVLGCPLANTPGYCPLSAMDALVTTAASIMLFQLVQGENDPGDTRPIRGGIDVSMGAVVQPEGYLYSPALGRVYDMESKSAIYPRILVGDRVVNYVEAYDFEERFRDYYSDLKRAILQMLFRDHDGKWAVDFLSTRLRSTIDLDGDKDFAQNLAGAAWRFARSSERRAKQAGNGRVAAKYAWLVDYMEPRLPLWDVKT